MSMTTLAIFLESLQHAMKTIMWCVTNQLLKMDPQNAPMTRAKCAARCWKRMPMHGVLAMANVLMLIALASRPSAAHLQPLPKTHFVTLATIRARAKTAALSQ